MSLIDQRHFDESIPVLGFVGAMGAFAAAMMALLTLGAISLG